MISYVLIGFVSISLVVSSIMIGIITYISVLERTKEIDILLTLILNIPINMIISKVTGVNNLSSLPVFGGLILILISVILTLIAGLVPSRIASKKDPVESLRSE